MTRDDLAEIAEMAGAQPLHADPLIAAAERLALNRMVLDLHRRHAVQLGLGVAEISSNLRKVPPLTRRPSPFTRDREEIDA